MEYRKICENTQDMSTWELSHNHIFIKNGEAWYRDFERELPVRELMKEICRKHGSPADADTLSSEGFDDVMYDNLQFGTDELEGVFSLMYMTMVGMAEVREWLKEYTGSGLPAIKKPEVLKAAISTYGKEAQVDMVIEEMSELTKALLKYRRSKNTTGIEYGKLRSNIIEEAADVLIMVAQIIIMFDKDGECQAEVDYKVNRLYERLGLVGKVLADGAAQGGLFPAT
ncbi:MAG: hypothetical protein U0I48_03555 [Acutalibacteraceae bacterium]|nr:hypothetical protein [Acutalibacteraceae bacterium]